MFEMATTSGEKGIGEEQEAGYGSQAAGSQDPMATIGDVVTGGDKVKLKSIMRQ